ncbi:MAG: hypothetical protein P4L50_00170 [Anaerolineaceae bacterium]|nr:hypothetical protein [Anaerolineaceae bacterium]
MSEKDKFYEAKAAIRSYVDSYKAQIKVLEKQKEISTEEIKQADSAIEIYNKRIESLHEAFEVLQGVKL